MRQPPRAHTRSRAVCGALWLALSSFAAGAEPEAPAGGEPPADAVLASLPFDPAAPPRRIAIDLAPKGNARRLPFFLDTGATNSLVTPRLARSMGVKVSRVKQDAYRRSTVLGRDVLFYVDTRRGDTGSSSPFEFGVLGGDFLAQYVVELDFARHLVRFLDPERFEVPAAVGVAGEAVLPLKLVSNRPALRASLDGHAVDLLIDTGMPPGLVLSGAVARDAHIAFEPAPQYDLAIVRGSVDPHVGEVRRLEIGTFAFEKLAAVVAPDGLHNLGFPGDCVLGFDLLAQFLVRIDYPRQRIWLRRDPEAKPLFDPRRPEAESQMSWTIPPEPEDALVAKPPRDESAAPHGVAATRDESATAATRDVAAPALHEPSDALEPKPARDTSRRQIWLEWRTPAADARIAGPVGFVPVEGWAGVGDPIRHDVVLAIDVSGSTAIASGDDVDGDGSLGRQRRNLDDWRTFNPRHLSSDAGDTVLAAEIAAARRLVELLDPERTRIGIVAFSDKARILAPLGSERARIEEVLEQLDDAWGAGSTNLADALARGAEVLRIESPGRIERRKTLLVLSDGWPTAPGSEELAAQEALKQARLAAADGVRIDSFGLGLEQRGEDDVYARIATLSGGHYLPLPRPAAVMHELPRIDLADVAGIEISNVGTGSAGRAVRVLPDGSFDGVVLLEAGENRIRVTARDDAGATHADERDVFYDARAPRDAEEAAAFERHFAELRRKLEQRRVETELIAEIQAARAQRRELELHTEE